MTDIDTLKPSGWMHERGGQPCDGAGLYLVNCWHDGWRLARWTGAEWRSVDKESGREWACQWRIGHAYKLEESIHLEGKTCSQNDSNQ